MLRKTTKIRKPLEAHTESEYDRLSPSTNNQIEKNDRNSSQHLEVVSVSHSNHRLDEVNRVHHAESGPAVDAHQRGRNTLKLTSNKSSI